jgi:hypothetical protein
MKLNLYLVVIFLIHYSISFEIEYKDRFLSDLFISCDTKGICTRSDNVKLKIGWISKVPLKDFTQLYNPVLSENIISINPYEGSYSLSFLKGSKNYTCADGVNECFNSCCNKGLCSDPSNICTVALKSSAAIIYGTCIGFGILTIIYWVAFGIIGVKYSKKNARVQIKENTNDIVTNNPPESSSNRSKVPSVLDNFDDAFNNPDRVISQNNNLNQVFSHNDINNPLMDLIEDVEAEESKKKNIFNLQNKAQLPEGESSPNNSEFKEHILD